jgi:hypothetical protein
LAIFGGGGLMTYLAALTAWLKPYAPFSWGLAFLLGVLFLSVVFLAINKAREVLLRITISRAYYSSHVTTMNVLESTFQRERININDFVHPFHRIVKGKTFIDCEIIGPANVIFQSTPRGGSAMSKCDLDGSRAVVIKEHIPVPFSIVLLDCTFLRCTIFGLTIFATEAARPVFAEMPEEFWLTPTGPPAAPPPAQAQPDTPEKT